MRLVQHPECIVHTAPTFENDNLKISRVVVYTHSSIVVKRLPDLEDKSLLVIWLEVGLPKMKKILVANVYREWQHMGQSHDNPTGSVQSQLLRWCMFLDKWETALLEDREVLVLGDIHFDFLKWNRTDLSPTDSSNKLKPLTDLLFNRIIPHGVSQLVSTATRVSPSGTDSGLDHVYSNKPEKCSDIQAELNGGSDHKTILVTRFAKSYQRSVRYVCKRSYKHFNMTSFCEAIRQISWFDVYTSEDPNQAAKLLTTKLTNVLDVMAPVRRIQVRKKYVPWLSEGTKKLIKTRDEAQAKAAISKDQDDWRNFKNLRNSVTGRARDEKKMWEKNKLDSSMNDPVSIWRSVRTWLGWGNSGPPT